MADYLDELTEIIVAASVCPVCETLAFVYRSRYLKHHDSWEFLCPICATGFVVPENELVFQSLPQEWLSTAVYAA